MQTSVASIKNSLLRQVTHWHQAACRMASLDHLASGMAWQGIDHNIGVALKQSLQQSVNNVIAAGNSLKKQLETTEDPASLRAIKRGLMLLRDQYLKTEETIHFYTVAAVFGSMVIS